jgi:hypothetical protein
MPTFRMYASDVISLFPTGVDSNHAIRLTVSVKRDKKIDNCVSEAFWARVTINDGRAVALAHIQFHATSNEILEGTYNTGVGFRRTFSVFPC